MKLPTSIVTLMDKPMNRAEFLKYIGVASLFLVGLGSILRSLTNASRETKTAHGSSYGTNPYGG